MLYFIVNKLLSKLLDELDNPIILPKVATHPPLYLQYSKEQTRVCVFWGKIKDESEEKKGTEMNSIISSNFPIRTDSLL